MLRAISEFGIRPAGRDGWSSHPAGDRCRGPGAVADLCRGAQLHSRAGWGESDHRVYHGSRRNLHAAASADRRCVATWDTWELKRPASGFLIREGDSYEVYGAIPKREWCS